MLRSLGTVIRKRPKTTSLVLALLILAGTGVGLYVYALRQWHAAQAAVKGGRLEEARQRLDVCLFVWPRSATVHLLAARAARLNGDFDKAETHLNQCKKLQHGASDAVKLEFLLMRVQGGEGGEEDEAVRELRACVENKHPETPLILETLSRSYINNLRYGAALACLNRWVQEAPDSAEPLHWRGWVLE